MQGMPQRKGRIGENLDGALAGGDEQVQVWGGRSGNMIRKGGSVRLDGLWMCLEHRIGGIVRVFSCGRRGSIPVRHDGRCRWTFDGNWDQVVILNERYGHVSFVTIPV